MQEKEQEKLLEEASTVVREQGCYMKRAIVRLASLLDFLIFLTHLKQKGNSAKKF